MITIKDKQFEIYKSAEELAACVRQLAERIDNDYAGRTPVILGFLNGAFIFTSDLVRHLNIPCEVHFARFSSYLGIKSTGNVRQLMELNADLNGRDVIIAEDIVETGLTIKYAMKLLKEKGARSVEVATLLYKPQKLTVNINVKYPGMIIPNAFVVGYGLDYDNLGRNLPDLYTIVE